MIKHGKASALLFAMLGVAAIVAAGCGDPDSGKIDMAAVKAAAAERGIPDTKGARPASVAAGKLGKQAPMPRPTQALPKGGR